MNASPCAVYAMTLEPSGRIVPNLASLWWEDAFVLKQEKDLFDAHCAFVCAGGICRET